MKRLLATLALATVALAAAACSSTNAGGGRPAPAAPADPNAPAITAKDLKFGESNVKVPAGKAVPAHLHQPGERAAQRRDLHATRRPPATCSSGEIFSSGSKVYQVPALRRGQLLLPV